MPTTTTTIAISAVATVVAAIGILGCCYPSCLESLTMPIITTTNTASSPLTAILVSTMASSALAAADLSWYAPAQTQINNLTTALSADGVYGFIFNSSATPESAYGTYNWCNMPHVRRSEYVVAPREYELQYVEVIQRHHKRTPYDSNGFPEEPYEWNCDDQGLFYYGAPFTRGSESPARGYWTGVQSAINPFVPSGWQGSCQFPQITSEGLDDSYVHGADIYEVYHDLLKFLPSRHGHREDWRDSVVYRVTNNQITSQVAGMLIAGTWRTTSDVPLQIQAEGVDSLEPQYTCDAADALFSGPAIKAGNARWDEHLAEAEALFATLDAISGVPANDAGWHESFDHYFDNLSARQCHQDKPFPCSEETGDCVDQELADAVYRMGQWEYSHMYRDAGPATLEMGRGSYGVWVAELADHLRGVVEQQQQGQGKKNGKGKGGKEEDIKTKYFHNVAHDGSVSRLLAILQLDVMVWPGMGSEIVFEMYRKRGTDSYFVRVLFGGQTLRSSNPSLGLMDMVPLDTLLAYFDGLVGEEASLIKETCEA